MPAYIIVEIGIHNFVEYEEYKKLTPATLAAHNGKFVVRGGMNEILKEIGIPDQLLCLNFRMWSKQKNGGALRNMLRQKRSDKIVLEQKCF